MGPRGSARARAGGFTLFEVLAGVAILGILYVVLANVAISATRVEGESSRRLEAALKADNALADIERGFALGVAPPVGSNEIEEDGFVVATEVRPLDLSAFASALTATEAGAAAEGGREQPPLPTLLAPPGQGPPPLLEIEVAVGWIEGTTPLEVRRLTYGFDVNAVASELQALADRAATANEARDREESGEALDSGGIREPETP